MLTGSLQAAKISPETAGTVARNFMARQGVSAKLTLIDCGLNEMYLFAATPSLKSSSDSEAARGFVLVAGDDCVRPILGYSLTAPVTTPLPENMSDWIQGYAEEIAHLRESGIKPSPQVRAEWETLLHTVADEPLYSVVVNPLLTTTWKQGAPYNELCPHESNGNDSKAGCVAIAMAQVMKYWNHPAQGVGSYSYTYSPYGTLSANFGTTTYDWANMSNSLTSVSPTANINAVATLVYHAGVSANMKYGHSSSSAPTVSSNMLTTITAERALRTYFKYDKALHSVRKSVVGDSIWMALLDNELASARPVIFSGRDTSGGHSFVCDGSNNAGLYHFNWGWGGYCDGYYPIGALNPAPGGTGGNATSRYNLENKMIIGIRPDTVLSGTHTLTTLPDAPAHGSVTGGGNHTYGDTVELTASANSRFRFSHWSDGMCYNPRSLIMGGDKTYTAVYDSVYGDTLRYDNGEYVNSWGYSTARPYYWGIKLEPELLASHTQLDAVQAYFKVGTYQLMVYNGATPSASTRLHTMSVAPTEEGWLTVSFANALTIDTTLPVWIILYNDNITYPACAGTYCGHAQASYNNTNGTSWTLSSTKRTFLIRGIFHAVELPETVSDTTETEACGSFVWEDSTYTESGIYERMFTASTGGDSLRVLLLTIHPEYHLFDTVTAVDSFLWVDNQVYTESGTYDFLATTVHGCDSLLTLVLTVNPSAHQGITTADADGIVLYPVPTSGKLYFGLPVESAEVYDALGRRVAESGHGHSIDLATLPAGVYLVRLRLDNGTLVTKRIEKR